jgi:hypothetical protein
MLLVGYLYEKFILLILISVVLGLVNSSWFLVCNDTRGPALAPSALVRVAICFSDTVVSSYYITISTEQNT